MKKIENYKELEKSVKEDGGSLGLRNTQYICKIIEAVDYPEEKEHLKIKYDICGIKHLPEILKDNKEIKDSQEFTNKIKERLQEQSDNGMYAYFYKGMEKFGEWSWKGYIDQYYTEKSQEMFTKFIIAIKKSNDNFDWNWKEEQLNGKFFIANIGEHEYNGNVYQKCQEVRSLTSYVEGKVKDLKLKEDKNKSTSSSTEIDTGDFKNIEDDLPF